MLQSSPSILDISLGTTRAKINDDDGLGGADSLLACVPVSKCPVASVTRHDRVAATATDTLPVGLNLDPMPMLRCAVPCLLQPSSVCQLRSSLMAAYGVNRAPSSVIQDRDVM